MNFELRILRDADTGDVLGSVLSGAGTGATIGSAFPGLGTAIGAVGGAAIGLFSGLSQKKKGKAILDANQRPLYQIPSAIRENKTMAENMALNGLPSAQYKEAADNIRENQMATLRNAQDRRSAVQALPSIQKVTGQQYAKLYGADAAARVQNQRQLLGVNSQYAGYQDRAFNWNQRDKYLQDYNYGMSLLGMGNQNIIGGLDSLAAGAALFGDKFFRGNTRRNGTSTDPFYTTPLRKANIGSTSLDINSGGNSLAA